MTQRAARRLALITGGARGIGAASADRHGGPALGPPIERGRFGITANAVAPGLIDSDMSGPRG